MLYILYIKLWSQLFCFLERVRSMRGSGSAGCVAQLIGLDAKIKSSYMCEWLAEPWGNELSLQFLMYL